MQTTDMGLNMIFYSALAKGFYCSEVHETDDIPADAVEITASLHLALLAGESEGKVIMPPDLDHDLPWLAHPTPPTLGEFRQWAIADLRAKRKSVEYGGFDLNGQRWDSAEKDELRLNSVSKIFESGIPQYEGWKIAEGVYITLTPELLQQATFALMQHYGRCFAVEAAKLAELEELDTPEEVVEWLETNLNQGW